MTLQGVPVVQGVAKDIEKSAMQAEMAQERQARLNDNHDGSHGIRDFALGSIASLRSRQGTFGQPGLSTPLSNLEMPALPASHSFTDFSMSTPLSDLEMPALPASLSFMGFGDGIYGWGYATESPISQDDQAALHATIVWRLRRPPGVIVAPVNTVRAATGSRRSAQSAQASAGSATVSGQQNQDAEGGNGSQSASPNAANSSAPVTGVVTATGEAAVASNDHVLMIQSSAESGDRMCYYPEDRESVFALGSASDTTALDEGPARAAFYDISPAPLHHRTYQTMMDDHDRGVRERQAAETQAASQNDNGVQHSSADTV